MRMTASWCDPYGSTEYKVVARSPRLRSGLPSGRHPDHTKRAVVLEAAKVWLGGAVMS